MKVYVAPTAITVRVDSRDMLCSSKGFTTDDDVFDDTSGEGEEISPGGNGSYDLPIV